jgi:hypothetical protein
LIAFKPKNKKHFFLNTENVCLFRNNRRNNIMTFERKVNIRYDSFYQRPRTGQASWQIDESSLEYIRGVTEAHERLFKMHRSRIQQKQIFQVSAE